VQDLEKTKTMLKIQKDINVCTLKEKEKLVKDQKIVQSEYGMNNLIPELRLEEHSRLLDYRKSKIEKLERALKEQCNNDSGLCLM
jgi:hypothetical protein